MREIKFKYGYSDGEDLFERVFTLEQIEQGVHIDEISDSPLLKNYKIIYRLQCTNLQDKNNIEIYDGDVIKCTYGVGVIEYIESYFRIYKPNVFSINLINEVEKLTLEKENATEVIGNIYKYKKEGN